MSRSKFVFTLILMLSAASESKAAGTAARQADSAGAAARHVPAGLVGADARKDSRDFTGEVETPYVQAGDLGQADLPEATDPENAPAVESSDAAADLRIVAASQAASLRTVATDERTAWSPARMISPPDGSTLTSQQSFEWEAVPDAGAYWLWVGSCRDCTDLFDANMGTRRSAVVGLPSDGRAIYVTVFTYAYGGWWWHDYTYVAGRGTARASLLSPSNGDRLDPQTMFRWTTGAGVSEYWLRVGSCTGCSNIYDGSQARQTARILAIPTVDRVFVTLYSYIDGAWYWNQYEFQGPQPTRGRFVTVRVNVTNRLRYAVIVSVNGDVRGSVPAGETRYVEATVPGSMRVSWSLDRPELSGRELGDTMGGSFSEVANPVGPYSYTVDNVVGSSQFFIPMITNTTGVGMLMAVNSGLAAENRCDCVIPAHRANVAAGYYRLFSNSNVRLFRTGSNYTGSYRYWGSAASPLHPSVERETGILRLTANIAP